MTPAGDNMPRGKSKTKDKKKNKKRFRWTLLKIIFFVLLGGMLWCAWEYTKPNEFPIKQVKIFATYERLDKNKLQDVVSSYLNNGFFYLNVFGLKKRLLDFPWIYAVSIKREWPDTVIINVVEERAILQWGDNSLINSFGTVFSPHKSSFPKNLPIIFGPEGKESKVFDLYKKIEAALEPLDLSVKKFLLNTRHYWEILLSNNVIVYLKEADPLGQIEVLVSLYRKITGESKKAPASFDMRYQSGLAVKWKEG